jgi:hypothetical protein
MSQRFDFALVEGNLPEHRQTAQGAQVGKTDVSLPYSFNRLKDVPRPDRVIPSPPGRTRARRL